MVWIHDWVSFDTLNGLSFYCIVEQIEFDDIMDWVWTSPLSHWVFSLQLNHIRNHHALYQTPTGKDDEHIRFNIWNRNTYTHTHIHTYTKTHTHAHIHRNTRTQLVVIPIHIFLHIVDLLFFTSPVLILMSTANLTWKWCDWQPCANLKGTALMEHSKPIYS